MALNFESTFQLFTFECGQLHGIKSIFCILSFYFSKLSQIYAGFRPHVCSKANGQFFNIT